jgi:hypothetical protein
LVLGDRGLTRTDLLERAGLVGAAALLSGLPDLARLDGFLEDAFAATPRDVRETFEGLVAYVVPGPDRYSRQQGQRSRSPGGVAAGGADVLIRTLDRFIVTTPPFSTTVAAFLNGLSPQRRGPFASRFANLTSRQKRTVLDALTSSPQEALRFLGGNLPGLAAFASYSEAAAFDRRRRRLRGRPLGWRLSGYDGLADGRAELKGYFRGRRSADA